MSSSMRYTAFRAGAYFVTVLFLTHNLLLIDDGAVQVREDRVEWMEDLMVQCMEGGLPIRLDVPLPVRLYLGTRYLLPPPVHQLRPTYAGEGGENRLTRLSLMV
jgi:hypothetical protein